MARPVDRRQRQGSRESSANPRFELDRVWVTRVAVAIVVIVAFVLIGKVSIMAFSGGGKRLERYEQNSDGNAAQPSSPRAAPSSPR